MILLWAENHNEEPLVLQFRCPGLFYLCITPWCHITFIRKTHGPSLVARIPDGVVRNHRRIKAEILKGYGIEECMNEMKKKCKSKKEKEGKNKRRKRSWLSLSVYLKALASKQTIPEKSDIYSGEFHHSELDFYCLLRKCSGKMGPLQKSWHQFSLVHVFPKRYVEMYRLF